MFQQRKAATFLVYFATLLYVCCSCPFLDQESENSAQSGKLRNDALPNGGIVKKNSSFRTESKKTVENKKTHLASDICSAYNQIKADFEALLPPGGNPAEDFIRSNIFGKALRLTFHDAGEIDITQSEDTFGPDGCLSSTAENAGLFGSATMVDSVFEPIYQNYHDSISRADFWALLGWLSINLSSRGAIPISFQYGRKDAVTCEVPNTRLPSGQPGLESIKRVFVYQMGLTLHDAVTLIGAHTLGHVHPKCGSGYGVADTPDKAVHEEDLQINAWDRSPQTFDNEYYKGLINEGWKNHGDVITNTHELTNWEPTSERYHFRHIMLNSDMVLGYDSSTVDNYGVLGQWCGPYTPEGKFVGCRSPDGYNPPETVTIVQKYAANNAYFLEQFAKSFHKLTSVGYGDEYQNRLGEALIDLTC